MSALAAIVLLAGESWPAAQEEDLPKDAIYRLEGHSDGVACVSFSPSGRSLLSASRDRTLALWDLTTGKRVRVLEGHKGGVRSASFLPSGRRAISGGEDKRLILWDLETGKEIRTFTGHSIGIRSVLASPDGRLVFSGSGDRSFALWDAESGRQVRSVQGLGGWVLSASFSPDGRRVLVGNLDRTVSLYDVEKLERLWSAKAHTDNVWSVAIGPDGRSALSAGGDAGLVVWDLESGQAVRRLAGPERGLFAVAWSPDGRFAATGGKEKKIHLWDVTEGKVVRELEGHAWEVQGVAYSPGGRHIASASEDSSILVWRVHEKAAREAAEWARSWKAKAPADRRRDLAEIVSGLASYSAEAFAETLERALASQGEAVEILLEKYPPEVEAGPLTEERWKKLLEELDSEEFEIRSKARGVLQASGLKIVPWIEERLKAGAALSAEVRGALHGILKEVTATSFLFGDHGRVRAVLILLEMPPGEAALKALRRYASGPERSYAAELARRALRD